MKKYVLFSLLLFLGMVVVTSTATPPTPASPLPILLQPPAPTCGGFGGLMQACIDEGAVDVGLGGLTANRYTFADGVGGLQSGQIVQNLNNVEVGIPGTTNVVNIRGNTAAVTAATQNLLLTGNAISDLVPGVKIDATGFGRIELGGTDDVIRFRATTSSDAPRLQWALVTGSSVFPKQEFRHNGPEFIFDNLVGSGSWIWTVSDGATQKQVLKASPVGVQAERIFSPTVAGLQLDSSTGVLGPGGLLHLTAGATNPMFLEANRITVNPLSTTGAAHLNLLAGRLVENDGFLTLPNDGVASQVPITTLNPEFDGGRGRNYFRVRCEDPDGCELRFATTGQPNGAPVTIISVGLFPVVVNSAPTISSGVRLNTALGQAVLTQNSTLAVLFNQSSVSYVELTRSINN